MELETLKRLALLGAAREQVSLSSSTLAPALCTSTQTAARRLASLEEEGLISRIVTSEGQKVRITDRGVSALKAEYQDYRKIFEDPCAVKIRGRVVTGLGEGQYYITREGYRR